MRIRIQRNSPIARKLSKFNGGADDELEKRETRRSAKDEKVKRV
jgi:hypothetical protein